MKNSRLALVCAAAVALLAIAGCGPNPNQGFTIVTKEVLQPQGLPGIKFPLVEMPVEGYWIGSGGGNPGGSVTSYDADTDVNGRFYLSNAVVPAYWNHMVWLPTYCQYPLPPVNYVGPSFGGLNEFQVVEDYTQNLSTIEWDCVVPPGFIPEASSRFAIAGNIPPSVTLSSLNPFTTQYGMPVMYMFNGSSGTPNLYSTITASSVDPSGLSATFPLPSSLPQGGYAFETANSTLAGGYSPNSFNLYSIASSQTIAGNPFGVSVASQTVTDRYCSTTGGGGGPNPNVQSPVHPSIALGGGSKTTCTLTNTTNTFPVISLYSQNAALIGGVPVPVGADPTAVVAYNAPAVVNRSSDYGWSDMTTTSGLTRALVANSGGNTVSIVDLVNDAVLQSVTVGNSPVSLAVSADGSTAYVANYTDGTVTQISLTNGSVLSTVSVGGSPTSLALTSGGMLWVGGPYFLPEVSTSTMSVVASEMPRKTIVGLAYSDGVQQLAVTAVDGAGNVQIDQIDPASVSTGAIYSPHATTAVSMVSGTRCNLRNLGACRQICAQTLANAPTINGCQLGAAPLAVQDGWAVISATPTGFSITDISGGNVLVSETTPSPITAIALDKNLSVAYLTMPDANTVLTVPLPGTN